MPIQFFVTRDVDGNVRLLKAILQLYLYKDGSPIIEKYKQSVLKMFTDLNLEELPEHFIDLMDMYLNRAIDENERITFMDDFRVPFQSTEKSVQQLYTLNPEAMTPVLDELIKSKRIQTLVYREQGDILGQLVTHIKDNLGPMIRKVGDESKRDAILDAIKAKRTEVNNMYEPQEAQIAIAWIAAQEREPKFAADETNYKLTGLGIDPKNRTQKRLPNVSPELMEAFRQMAREKAAKNAANRAAGGSNKSRKSRRNRRRKQTRRRR